jgi:hypothetical protein
MVRGSLTAAWARVVLVVMAALIIVPFALGQLPTATILGEVKDASGAVMADVAVTATNTETNAARTTNTGSDGSYRFPALPVGSYEIRAEHAGFQTEVRTGLTLTVSQEATINLTMNVGSTQQTVSVVADAPLVNTASPILGGLVSEERVADLPLNGRNYIDLALLQPGVQKMANIGQTTGLQGTWFTRGSHAEVVRRGPIGD